MNWNTAAITAAIIVAGISVWAVSHPSQYSSTCCTVTRYGVKYIDLKYWGKVAQRQETRLLAAHSGLMVPQPTSNKLYLQTNYNIPQLTVPGFRTLVHINLYINHLLLYIYLKVSGSIEASGQEAPFICNRSKNRSMCNDYSIRETWKCWVTQVLPDLITSLMSLIGLAHCEGWWARQERRNRAVRTRGLEDLSSPCRQSPSCITAL